MNFAEVPTGAFLFASSVTPPAAGRRSFASDGKDTDVKPQPNHKVIT
jgi:hypothetical protein